MRAYRVQIPRTAGTTPPPYPPAAQRHRPLQPNNNSHKKDLLIFRAIEPPHHRAPSRPPFSRGKRKESESLQDRGKSSRLDSERLSVMGI